MAAQQHAGNASCGVSTAAILLPRVYASATGARIMNTVIQNVIGTIASAYSRSSSVAMRGASGCVDSRSCAQDSTAA